MLGGATGDAASSDGSVFVLMVATMVDTEGAVYGGNLEPGVTVEGQATGRRATDPVLVASMM
ncbi:MAG: hypothetical protein ACPHQP_00010 [Longimicrobiales bacterium]